MSTESCFSVCQRHSEQSVPVKDHDFAEVYPNSENVVVFQ